MDFRVVHEMAVAIVREYESVEVRLIEVLQLVNREKVHKKMNYTSVFSYAVEALKIPAERVYQLNGVAKKCDEVPELKEAIDQGVLNVSQARRIVSVIKKDTSKQWIEKAVTLKQRDLEKEVAKVNPKEATPERTKILNATDAFISLSLSIEAKEELERIQEVRGFSTLREALEYSTKFTLERIDPVKKAQRNVSRPPRKLSSRTNSKRPQAHTKHEVTLRDKGQCTKVVNGKRCSNKRWLDTHHIKLVSHGGKHTADNLTTLCRAHHRMEHDPGAA